MSPRRDLFQVNNNAKCKNTTKQLSKHECYKALNDNNIKLWIWYRYHMVEKKHFITPELLRCHCESNS